MLNLREITITTSTKFKSGTREARLMSANFWTLDFGLLSMAKRIGITSGFICSTCSSKIFSVAPREAKNEDISENDEKNVRRGKGKELEENKIKVKIKQK